MKVKFQEQERAFPVSFGGNDTRINVEFSGGGGGGVPYRGEYEVTPAEEEQTLQTANRILAHDVVINPVPDDYARMAWNGASLLFY